MKLEEPDWCGKCHNYIIPMSVPEYVWSRICYRLVLWWPVRFMMSPPCVQMLPWAGNVAYRCICLPKCLRTHPSGDHHDG